MSLVGGAAKKEAVVKCLGFVFVFPGFAYGAIGHLDFEVGYSCFGSVARGGCDKAVHSPYGVFVGVFKPVDPMFGFCVTDHL